MKSNFSKIYQNPIFLFPYEHPLNKFPFYVDIELTNACNLNCLMCSRRVMKRKQGFMDWVTFKKVVDEITGFKTGIRFARQGEPFFHRDIIEMCGYVKDKGLLLFISTNGLLLNEELCRQIIDLRIDEIRFSMQGTGREGYKRLRVDGDYDLFAENIRLLRQLRDESEEKLPFISLSTSITDEGEDEIERFRSEWEERVDSVNIDATDFSYVKGLDAVRDFLPSESLERIYKPCTEVVTKLSVNWNGDITSCCRDYDGELIIGNIKDMPLLEAWDSERLNKLRTIVGEACNHSKLPFCSKCFHRTKKFDNAKKSFAL